MRKMGMSNCEYVRDTYGVPAEIGRRIRFRGDKEGVIIKDMGNYIGVNFDSDKPGIAKPLHPTWEVEYLEIGSIRKMTKSQKRYQEYCEIRDCFNDFAHFLRWKEYKRKNSEGEDE